MPTYSTVQLDSYRAVRIVPGNDTVTVLASGTTYYSQTEGVSSTRNDGTIVAGGQFTVTAPTYFLSSSTGTLRVTRTTPTVSTISDRYAVGIRQVAADRIRLLYPLGSERFWGVDLWQTTGLPGAGGISGYVAPNILSRAAIYEPYQQVGSYTRTGTWGSKTTQALASGGGYYFSTTAGDTITATVPAGTTRLGVRTVAASNAGFAKVTGVNANRLPTAAQLVANGRLSSLGALDPTDRILDLYAAASDPTTTIDYDRHFIIADGPNLGGSTVTLTVVAEKNFASSANRLYISDNPFTYSTVATTRGTNGASLLASTRICSQLDSAYEYAHEIGVPGTPTFVGNVHGYESQTALAVVVDDVSQTLSAGDQLWGNRVTIVRDTQLYHPSVGSGNTAVANVKTTYALSALGLDVSWRLTPLQSLTFSRSYSMMFPGDGGVYSTAIVGGASYALGANDNTFKGQSQADYAQLVGSDTGGMTITNTLTMLDRALSVNNFSQSAVVNTAVEDRTPTNANVGNVKKIYVARVHTTGGPLSATTSTILFSAGRYTVATS